jgi:hypothetical protein
VLVDDFLGRIRKAYGPWHQNIHYALGISYGGNREIDIDRKDICWFSQGQERLDSSVDNETLFARSANGSFAKLDVSTSDESLNGRCRIGYDSRQRSGGKSWVELLKEKWGRSGKRITARSSRVSTTEINGDRCQAVQLISNVVKTLEFKFIDATHSAVGPQLQDESGRRIVAFRAFLFEEQFWDRSGGLTNETAFDFTRISLLSLSSRRSRTARRSRRATLITTFLSTAIFHFLL